MAVPPWDPLAPPAAEEWWEPEGALDEPEAPEPARLSELCDEDLPTLEELPARLADEPEEDPPWLEEPEAPEPEAPEEVWLPDDPLAPLEPLAPELPDGWADELEWPEELPEAPEEECPELPLGLLDEDDPLLLDMVFQLEVFQQDWLNTLITLTMVRIWKNDVSFIDYKPNSILLNLLTLLTWFN